ncbi:hypothetical protein V1517DRAFT_349321 [Lipomyces orientalis]|uniref:Uncharacterized protein n=1 Tax=Lipomyces orientalis TaxID=1233043 RepID=A0ACC3TEC2_9ASCO
MITGPQRYFLLRHLDEKGEIQRELKNCQSMSNDGDYIPACHDDDASICEDISSNIDSEELSALNAEEGDPSLYLEVPDEEVFPKRHSACYENEEDDIDNRHRENEEGEYKITWKEFQEVEELLENRRAEYSYNTFNGILRFVMPTFIHASCNTWITKWVQEMVASGDIEPAGVEVFIDATLKDFKEYYNRRRVNYHGDSFGIISDSRIAVSWNNYGIRGRTQKGRIGLVIVVKIEPLAPGETEIQKGFVQVYEYDQKLNRSVTRGRRKRLYPPPSSRLQQCLKFTWTEVLRNKIGEDISDSEQTPPLYLENSRTILDENIARHLAFKYPEDDDSERD